MTLCTFTQEQEYERMFPALWQHCDQLEVQLASSEEWRL